MLSFILSRRDLREFDQIISLYTREYGKLEILAKGVKKITSKNSAHLEILCLAEAEVAVGKEFSRLTRVLPVNIFKFIRCDLAKIFTAGYAAQTLDAFTMAGEKDVRIFSLLFSLFNFLNSEIKIDPLDLINSYTIKLWSLFGFGGDLTVFFKLAKEEILYLQSCLRDDWDINCFEATKTLKIKIFELINKFVQIHSGKPLANFVRSAKMVGII